MTKLIECPACTRHVRVDDGRCPFCGRPSTTAAPAGVLALVLPLALAACSSAEAPPASGTPGKAPTEAAKPTPVEPKPPEPVLVDPPTPAPLPADGADMAPPPQPSQPADDGAQADPAVPSDDRVMTTKYGGPPAMGEPEPIVVPEVRPAKKYGAPPRPDERPAPKYGAPPKPSGDGPLG